VPPRSHRRGTSRIACCHSRTSSARSRGSWPTRGPSTPPHGIRLPGCRRSEVFLQITARLQEKARGHEYSDRPECHRCSRHGSVLPPVAVATEATPALPPDARCSRMAVVAARPLRIVPQALFPSMNPPGCVRGSFPRIPSGSRWHCTHVASVPWTSWQLTQLSRSRRANSACRPPPVPRPIVVKPPPKCQLGTFASALMLSPAIWQSTQNCCVE